MAKQQQKQPAKPSINQEVAKLAQAEIDELQAKLDAARNQITSLTKELANHRNDMFKNAYIAAIASPVCPYDQKDHEKCAEWAKGRANWANIIFD